VGPRGAGGATQEGAGRAGGERHGGFVCVWLGEEAGDAGRDGTGRERRKRAEEATGTKIWCGGDQRLSGPPRFVEAWSFFASASVGRSEIFTPCCVYVYINLKD